jgi:hypothetical protein
MSSITTRAAKGSALTHAEVDANFTNLNSGKAEVSGQTFTGAVVLPAGSATAGGVQVGTGATYKPSIYSPGTDQLAISTGGSERLRADSSGRLLVGTSTNRPVTVGTSTNWNPRLQVSKTGIDGANIAAYNFSTYAVDLGGGLGIGPDFVLARSNSDTEGVQAAIANNMLLGRITFNGSDGTAFQGGAFIAATADGQTWASGDCPTRLVFATTADNAASPTERMRIDSTGLMTLAGPGIKFPATQVASSDPNTLDDYEEGTWTPTIGGTATYTTQIGRYTKVGNLVSVIFQLTVNTIGTGSTTSISGLPFTTNSTERPAGSVSFWTSLATNVLFLGCYLPSSNSIIAFTSATASGTNANIDVAIFGNNARVEGSMVYRV